MPKNPDMQDCPCGATGGMLIEVDQQTQSINGEVHAWNPCCPTGSPVSMSVEGPGNPRVWRQPENREGLNPTGYFGADQFQPGTTVTFIVTLKFCDGAKVTISESASIAPL